MARETSIQMSIINPNNDIFFIVDALLVAGWSVYNPNGKIDYLPFGDKDEYNWQEGKISFEKLRDIAEAKFKACEIVGVNLFFDTTGISLLIFNLTEVIMSLDIYKRSVVADDSNSFCDVAWYFQHIILALQKQNVNIVSYDISDIMG